MEKYENIKCEPIEIHLEDTIRFFRFKNFKKGKIISTYSTINDVEIDFIKDGESIINETAPFKKIDQTSEQLGLAYKIALLFPHLHRQSVLKGIRMLHLINLETQSFHLSMLEKN